jgi:hypothetical protein
LILMAFLRRFWQRFCGSVSGVLLMIRLHGGISHSDIRPDGILRSNSQASDGGGCDKVVRHTAYNVVSNASGHTAVPQNSRMVAHAAQQHDQ